MDGITILSGHSRSILKKPTATAKKLMTDEEYDDQLNIAESEVKINYSRINSVIQDIKSKEENFSLLRDKIMAEHNK